MSFLVRRRGCASAPRACVRLAAFALALITPLGAQAQLLRDSEIERTLRMLAEPIFRAANLSPNDIRIFFLANKSLNAFVTGGHNMFFHSGMLQRLETPEQLMGVMAHEAGHITGGHVVRRIAAVENARYTSIVTTLLGLGAAAAGGRSAGIGAVGAGQSYARKELLRFTRSQESSADQAALSHMNSAGVDPSGLLEVLEKLKAEQAVFAGTVDPYSLSHPLSVERLQALQLGVERSDARGNRVSEEMRYWHGRMRAKLDGFLEAPGSHFAATSYGVEEFDLYRAAISLHRLPEPDDAIAIIDRLIEMRPRDPYYWELKGQILSESGRGAAAVEPYRQAARLAPGDALISGGLGEALLSANTPATDKEALEVLERASLEDQFDASLRRALAIAYARQGQEGMASVVTAERLALTGRLDDARRQAERAQAQLPVGSPGWLRAEDIISLPEAR